MKLTITAEQRDALYGQIFDRLSGIGDVWLAVSMEACRQVPTDLDEVQRPRPV